MSHDRDLEKLTKAFTEAWQGQMQKLMTDPFVQQASQNYMQFVSKMGTGSAYNPFTASADSSEDKGQTSEFLAARLEDCERRISMLEAVVHGLLRNKESA